MSNRNGGLPAPVAWGSPFRTQEEAVAAAALLDATPLPDSSDDSGGEDGGKRGGSGASGAGDGGSGGGSAAGGAAVTGRPVLKGKRRQPRKLKGEGEASTAPKAPAGPKSRPRWWTMQILQKQLCAAIDQSDAEVVRKLLAEGADPALPGESQPTLPPLYLAALDGNAAIVQLLLAHKADPDQVTTKQGFNSLYAAADKGHVGVLRVLLEHDADPNQAKTDHGTSPLFVAAQHGNVAIVKALLDNNANPNQTKKTMTSTPIYIAAMEGHVAVTTLLLEYNADPNQSDGSTPLYSSAMKGHTGVVKVLLDHKADPNLTTSDGWTPLKIAAGLGHAATADLLVQASDNSESAEHFQPRRRCRRPRLSASPVNLSASLVTRSASPVNLNAASSNAGVGVTGAVVVLVVLATEDVLSTARCRCSCFYADVLNHDVITSSTVLCRKETGRPCLKPRGTATPRF